MRALILSLAVLASCASPAPAPTPAPTEKPSPFDTRITLSLQRATLKEAMDEIARASRLNIVMNANDGQAGICTLLVNDRPVGEVLDAVAKCFGLRVIREKYGIARITS